MIHWGETYEIPTASGPPGTPPFKTFRAGATLRDDPNLGSPVNGYQISRNL